MARDQEFRQCSSHLEEDLRMKAATFIHFPARDVGRLVFTGDFARRIVTHWKNGRPDWCWGKPRCSECAEYRGKKAHYVISCWDSARRAHGVFDFPPHAWADILTACEGYGFLRGLVVLVSKEGRKVNGNLVAEVMSTEVGLERYGEMCNVDKLICSTYGLDYSEYREYMERVNGVSISWEVLGVSPP